LALVINRKTAGTLWPRNLAFLDEGSRS
jgi:hypothetical protein